MGRTDGQTDGRTDGRSDCTPRPAFAFGDAGKNLYLQSIACDIEECCSKYDIKIIDRDDWVVSDTVYQFYDKSLLIIITIEPDLIQNTGVQVLGA